MKNDSIENYRVGQWVAVHNERLPHAGFPLKVRAVQPPVWILAADFSGDPVLLDLRRISLTKISSKYACAFKALWDKSAAKRAHLEGDDYPPVSIPGVSFVGYLPPPEGPPPLDFPI